MPTNNNLKQRMRQALYSLKREYGAGPLSVYTFGGTTVNIETGVKSVTKSVTLIDRVIILPAKVSRELVQTISTISANKQFVYGGTYDSRARLFIIDRLDAPGLELKQDDWFVYDGSKYEIVQIDEFEVRTGWVIHAKELLGETPEQIHPLATDHRLELSSTAVGEL